MSDFFMFPKKYRPTSVDEMVLDPWLKKKLNDILKKAPNIILCGTPGLGKSCFADIFVKETGYDYLKINASDENSVDVIRNKIKTFAMSASLTPLKIVYLDEGDNFKLDAAKILRGLIEQVEEHTRFIITCNYFDNFEPAILSRFQVINFKNPPATELFNRCLEILKKENVKVKDDALFKQELLELIKRFYPDMRRIFNTLEASIIDGEIEQFCDAGSDKDFSKILELLKSKDINGVRDIVRNSSLYYPNLYKFLFDNVNEFSNPAQAVLVIGNGYRWDSQVNIKEINFLTMCVELLKC